MTNTNILENAKSMINSGDYLGAESSLLARIKIEPMSTDVALLLAHLYFMQGRINDAIEMLQKHQNLRPCVDALREYFVGERLNLEAILLIQNTVKSGSTDNLLDQAITKQLSGDIASAIKLCGNVISMSPQNTYAYNHLGRALFNAKMTDDAQAAFEKAIKINQNYYQAWHNLGHVLRSKNNILEAEKAYQKSIDIAPYYQSAMLNLALLWMNQGKNSQAITLLDKIISINSNNAEALLNLGICHQILRNFDDAKNALTRAASIEPIEPRALRYLGNLYKELQDINSAIVCYRKALKVNPNDSDLVSELISTLELLNSLDEAQKIAEEAIIRMPDDANILFESAKISRRRGDYEKALVTLQNVNIHCLHPRLLQSFHYERATVFDRLSKFSEAFIDFKHGNDLAVTSIRARNTNKNALPAQMSAIKEWLERGAPTAVSETDEDLGSDLCFLIGFPRSGTTLLDVMLDGHTNVLSLEEKPTIERIAFMLDQMPGHYPDAMAALTREQRHMLRHTYRESIASYRLPEHTLVIDKMPIRTIHASFMHRLFPKAKFLFAERHPCDVVLSNFMQHYAINEAMIHFTQLESTVQTYDKVMELWQLSLTAFPNMPVHYVRYENLISNTEEVLRSACEFLNIPWQSGLEQHQRNLETRKQIKTNSYHQVAEPVYQRSKFRWLNYQPQLQPYMSILEPHIQRMKY